MQESKRVVSLGYPPNILVELVKVAMAAGTKARYLLFDSWFSAPATVRRIHALGMHTVCMLKDSKSIGTCTPRFCRA
jgi:hypothetical protein